MLGASENPSRYSNMAIKRLVDAGHEVAAVGLRKGEVAGVPIQTDFSALKDIHTVTLYLGPKNQSTYTEAVLELKPKRVIFNPGTVNSEFIEELESSGVEAVDACTLVMLSADTY